ncbi:uncharacterized protein LOC129219005 [Uloborus diversus]|uniref:uncharacterized protein LOC129219005 n=1 Tax=Uloborus diversus TaxID=327109 RepID=UPI002409EF6E|nr:uncharacterized protein LOC129219005 [Uloborus diversus]
MRPPTSPPNPSQEDLLQPGHEVKDRWRVVSKIGFGGFGEIYEALDITSNELVALKVEKPSKQSLKMEVSVIKTLQGNDGISRFVHAGKSSSFNYLVMELHGPSLADMKRRFPKGFTLSTTLRLGKEILKILTCLHEAGFIHRDIKPANFVVGSKNCTKNEKKIFMIDFGLAKQYRTSSGEVKPPRQNIGFRGTVRYASLSAHQHNDLGRNDDLWSFFYMLVEFVQGSLPWKGLKNHDAVRDLKAKIPPQNLIKYFPTEFEPFLGHLLQLTFEDTPDYALLENTFNECMQTRGVKDEDPYDWEHIKHGFVKTDYPAGPISVSEQSVAQKDDDSLSNEKLDVVKEKGCVKSNKNSKKTKKRNSLSNDKRQVASPVIFADDCNNFLQDSFDNLTDPDKQQNPNATIVPSTSAFLDATHISVENRSGLCISKSQSNLLSSSQFAVANGDTSIIQFTLGDETQLTSVSKLQESVELSKNTDPVPQMVHDMEFNTTFKERQYNFKNMFDFCSGFQFRNNDYRKGMQTQLNWQAERNGLKLFDVCEKRRRPVRRSVSHPAKVHPNVKVRSPVVKRGELSNFFQMGNLFSSGQSAQGLPRCWSCPTISLHIRSHLQPPLKQQASFDESVYEVDVMRNVAAKQTSVESVFSSDERRTSLPHISASDALSEENQKSNSMICDQRDNFTSYVKEKSDKNSFKSGRKSSTDSFSCSQKSICFAEESRNVLCKDSKQKSTKLQRSFSMPRSRRWEVKENKCNFNWNKASFPLKPSYANAEIDKQLSSIKYPVENSCNAEIKTNATLLTIENGRRKNSSTSFLNNKEVSTVNGTKDSSSEEKDISNIRRIKSSKSDSRVNNMKNNENNNGNKDKSYNQIVTKSNLLNGEKYVDSINKNNVNTERSEKATKENENILFRQRNIENSNVVKSGLAFEKFNDSHKLDHQLVERPMPGIVLDGKEKENKLLKELNGNGEIVVDNKTCSNNRQLQKEENSKRLIVPLHCDIFCNESSTSNSGEINGSPPIDEPPKFDGKSSRLRRRRVDPDSKYVNDESELKLNFLRRRQRPNSVMNLSPVTSQVHSYNLQVSTSSDSLFKPNNTHSIYKNEIKMMKSDSLDRAEESSIHSESKQVPIFYQDVENYENSVNKLSNGLPMDPPHNYHFSSRYPYHQSMSHCC